MMMKNKVREESNKKKELIHQSFAKQKELKTKVKDKIEDIDEENFEKSIKENRESKKSRNER